MSERERICIDIDHVLGDLIGSWVDKYNKIYNDNFKVEDATEWDWHKLVKPEVGKKIYSLLTPDLFENLEVIEGSQEAVRKLTERFDVYLVTAASNAIIIPSKANWIKKNFPFIDKSRIVYAIDKSICNGQYLIDDKPENLETFRGEKLLFDACHNKKEDRFIRMNNWKEIEKYFEDK